MKELQDIQISWTKNLRESFKTILGEDSQSFKEIHNSLAPIVQAGINQGVPAALESAWRTDVSERAAAGGTQLAQAVSQGMAARAGGAGAASAGMSSGALAEVMADIGFKTKQSEMAGQREVTEKSYEYGRQNYEMAVKGMIEAPSIYGNLPGMASNVTGASTAAAQTAKDINEAKMAPWGMVAGIAGQALGGLASGGL